MTGVLACHGVRFTERRHSDFAEPIKEPADFARQLGYELARITKTLLVRSADRAVFALVVASMGSKVQFRSLAAQLGVKRVEVASFDELSAVTGYPRNGVSPIGVDGVRVFVDAALLRFPTILVGAGAIGVELEMAPADLVSVTHATSFALTS